MTETPLADKLPKPIAVVIEVNAQATPNRRTANHDDRSGLIPRIRESRMSNTRGTESVNPITMTSTGRMVVNKLIFTPNRLRKPSDQKLPSVAPANVIKANGQLRNIASYTTVATKAPAIIKRTDSVRIERKISARNGGKPVR